MTYLPVDYYILLQAGYKDKNVSMKRRKTNKILFTSLPILNQREVSFQTKNKAVMTSLTYDDLQRFDKKNNIIT